MNDRRVSASAVGSRRRFRLWHLSVAVLVAALSFGAIRALARGPNGPGIGGVIALALSSVAVGISYAIIRAGRAVAGRATANLKLRGVRIGGVIGFGVWLVGIGLEVGFVLASMVVGPVATIALVVWLLGDQARIWIF